MNKLKSNLHVQTSYCDDYLTQILIEILILEMFLVMKFGYLVL